MTVLKKNFQTGMSYVPSTWKNMKQVDKVSDKILSVICGYPTEDIYLTWPRQVTLYQRKSFSSLPLIKYLRKAWEIWDNPRRVLSFFQFFHAENIVAAPCSGSNLGAAE